MADVICPQCFGRYHETTSEYRPGVSTTGNMLRLKQVYKDNGWDSFPEGDWVSHGDLCCPECQGSYAAYGEVLVDQEQYAAEIELKGKYLDDREAAISAYQDGIKSILANVVQCDIIKSSNKSAIGQKSFKRVYKR